MWACILGKAPIIGFVLSAPIRGAELGLFIFRDKVPSRCFFSSCYGQASA